MATEVVKKKILKRSCGECGEEVVKGLDTCPDDDCGSTDIKKSLVIITKATGDDEDDLDLANAEVEDLTDEDDEDDDDSDDEDEEDDENENEEEPEPLTSVGKRVMAVETLNLTTSLAEKVSKIFSSKNISKASDAYEKAMEEFNGVMDAAVDTWLTGASVSKSSETKQQTALILKRVSKITKEGGAMPTKKRPDGLKIDELPDEVKAYISTLENGEDDGDVEKIYKGLTPEAAEIVKKSAQLIERDTANKYLEIAKGFTHVPGDKALLAKSLRMAAETNEESYKNLVETLTASNENLKQGDIFKSHGRPGNEEPGSDEEKARKKAEELVTKGDYETIEQAQVAMMGGDSYRPTNSVTA